LFLLYVQIANHTGQAEFEPVLDIDLVGEGDAAEHPFDAAVERANADHDSVAYFDLETGCGKAAVAWSICMQEATD